MPTTSTLHGARVRLRPWRPADVEAIHAACQDPDIQRFTTVPSPYRWSDAESFLADHVDDVAARGGAAFAVEDPCGPHVLGSMTLLHTRVDGERGRVGEIGYWTAPWARGRGYTAEALGILAAWAFEHRDVDELELVIETANGASRAVARRAGFVEVALDPTRRLGDGSVREMVITTLAAAPPAPPSP